MSERKKSETELTASVLKKKIQNTQNIKRTLFYWTKLFRPIKKRSFNLLWVLDPINKLKWVHCFISVYEAVAGLAS